MKILIVHGPNLNLLGEAKGDPCTFAELTDALVARGRELGAELKFAQSNHEGVLIDTIQSERRWAEAILVNPGALTHTSYALRECLRIVGLPAIEVHLEDIRRRETWRRKSVLKDVCRAQVMGKGIASYLDALERLASGSLGARGKKAAKPAAAAPAKSPLGKARPAAKESKESKQPKAAKTLGRAIPSADPARLLQQAAQASAPKQSKSLGREAGLVKTGIQRAAVRERIASRLGGRITPSALATWAREQWLNLERGAATEMGQRELLAESLQSLALSATPAGQMTDDELIDLMARLE
jgi:3-dehydroquinate dehydratase-2